MSPASAPTLERRLAAERRRSGGPPESVLDVVARYALASKAIAREARRGALVARLGLSGSGEGGDARRLLEGFACDVTRGAFEGVSDVAATISEELGRVEAALSGRPEDAYALVLDPLDGASNALANGALGSVFALLERPGRDGDPLEGLLGGPPRFVAAGFVAFGPSTLLALSLGQGVSLYALDRDLGEWMLVEGRARWPARSARVALNAAREPEWPVAWRRELGRLAQRRREAGELPTLRYTGTLAADLQRALVEGGVYAYPPTTRHPRGKLLHLVEAAPAAFLAEQAGARASDGRSALLARPALGLDARTPLVIGAAAEIEGLEEGLAEEGAQK